MSEKTPSFPLGQVLVILVFLGIFLAGLLAAQPNTKPTAPITPTVVALAETAEATAEATLETAVTAETTPASEAQAVAYTADEVMQGQQLFDTTCFACHGMEGQGIPGLGKDLITSTFVHDLSDEELIAFIAKGRPVSDPLNTTGVAMPARGGNPSLTDDKLHLIVAFIRSQQAKNSQQAAPAPTATPASAETQKPFVLPIESLGIVTGTVEAPTAAPTSTQSGFVLPIESLGIVTPTGAAASPEAAATEAATPEATASATSSGFVLPIESLGIVTATPTP